MGLISAEQMRIFNRKHLVWFRWGDMRQSLKNIVRCFSMISANQGQCWIILVPFSSSKFKNWLGLVVLVFFYHSKRRFFFMHFVFSISLHCPIVILRRPSLVLMHSFIIILSLFNRPTMSSCSYSIIFHDTFIYFLLCFTTIAFHPIAICVIFLVLLQMVWSMKSYKCYSFGPFIYGQIATKHSLLGIIVLDITLIVVDWNGLLFLTT